jgi:K+-transporting ATPase ATPase C chain
MGTTLSGQLRAAIVALGLLTVLAGVVYPLLVTGVAQVAFPWQAKGSLLEREGQAIGSKLIGREFSEPRYFWGRLSATGPCPYNAAASSGSNLGPTNPQLRHAAQVRIAALRAADPGSRRLIPADVVTASGSGLDPHISPAAAEYQVRRVARARGLDEGTVRRLVWAHTEGRQLGLLGEPRVNVFELNLALDRLR